MTPSPLLLRLVDEANRLRGVKLAWLAQQAKIAPQTLSAIRRGERPPTDLGCLFALIDAAGGGADDRAIILEELANYDASQRADKPGAGSAS